MTTSQEDIKKRSEVNRDSEICQEKTCYVILNKVEVKDVWTTIEMAVHRPCFQAFQSDLIKFYRAYHNTIPISPLAEENAAPLVDLYVCPPMVAVDLTRPYGNKQGIPPKTPISSYQEIFFRDDSNTYKEIYLTAEPGIGKTAFCKRLCMTWCQAHQPEVDQQDRFNDQDLKVMKKYDFFFLVTLQDVGEKACRVDEFVEEFIKDNLNTNYNESLTNILNEKSCLIVLDGLDEWSHPTTCKNPRSSIPHRKRRDKWTLLTTTRPWKLYAVLLPSLASAQIDRQIEINILSWDNSKELAKKAIELLNKYSHQNRDIGEFIITLSSLKLYDLFRLPHIYLYLVCLWFDSENQADVEKLIGKGKCEVYTNILEFTFIRKIQKQASVSFQTPLGEVDDKAIPAIMKGKDYCFQHWHLLVKLGKLAFFATFDDQNKHMLSFDDEFVKQYLNTEDLDMCLKFGFLSQHKSCKKVSKREGKVSFQHKSFQEFFAALYMHTRKNEPTADDCNTQPTTYDIDKQPTTTGDRSVFKTVEKVCTSISSILQMENVFVFLSGLNPDFYSQISKMLMTHVEKDTNTIKHRTRLEYLDDVPDEFYIMFDFQSMQVECFQEMVKNREKNIPAFSLQDIFINETSKKEEYITPLIAIIKGKEGIVKSFSVEMCESEEVAKIIQAIGHRSLHNLQKLEINAVARQEDLEYLLMSSKETLQCLSLQNYEANSTEPWKVKIVDLSERCTKAVFSMRNLQAIYLNSYQLSHTLLKNMADFITSHVQMTHVGLEEIRCKYHNLSCTGVEINLSYHEHLYAINIYSVPVVKLSLKTERLHECVIGKLPSDVIIATLKCLQGVNVLQRLFCRNIEQSEISTFIETIPSIFFLQELNISRTELGDNPFILKPEMSELKRIQLLNVKLTCSAIRGMAQAMDNLNQVVAAELVSCTLPPVEEQEYKIVKEEMKKSSSFRIIFDGVDDDGDTDFTFETVKPGMKSDSGSPVIVWL